MMEHRKTFTDMELENAKKNHSWMAKYYAPLKNATIVGVYIGIDDNHPTMAFPIFNIMLENKEMITCEIVCASELEMPGLITGLPIPE
jgi:hypothetical protein